MAGKSRRKTPDILGDLLGGSQPPASAPATNGSESEPGEVPEGADVAASGPGRVATESDPDYFETLLVRAGSALDLVAEVLGRRRLVQWLDEMKERFAVDVPTDRKTATASFKRGVATWAEKQLGAESTTISYSANGLAAREPYEVDIWAHFKGVGSQADLDIWIECRESEIPIAKEDISSLIDRACDVFHAAHTDRQEFWFDRLMLVSSSTIDAEALDMAQREGVTYVRYDGASYPYLSEGNWKLKPNWMREAEAGRGRP